MRCVWPLGDVSGRCAQAANRLEGESFVPRAFLETDLGESNGRKGSTVGRHHWGLPSGRAARTRMALLLRRPANDR